MNAVHPHNNSGAPLDAVLWLESDHLRQLAVCDALEAIADTLPSGSDDALLQFVIPILRDEFRIHMQFEDDTLFPLLKNHVEAAPGLNNILTQLGHEHEVDEFYGEELAYQLSELQLHGRIQNPEMLGYMLRGFFESQRRHIEWENNIVLPIVRKVLTSDELAELADQIPARLLHTSVPPTIAGCDGKCTDCKSKR